MNDYITEYLAELEEDTSAVMNAEQYASRTMAFTHHVLTEIASKVGAENFVVEHAELRSASDKNLGEIHAYSESDNGEVLTLFYTIYDNDTKNGIKVLNNSELQPIWNKIQGFYERAVNGICDKLNEDDPAYEITKLIDDHQDKYTTIRFYILSNYSIKQSAPKNIRVRKKGTDSNVWDIKKLYGNLTDTSDHVEINIDFENDEDYNTFKIPYIQMVPDESGYKCLLMMFPAKLLYRLYNKWNTDLLLYNVRYWLTFKKTKRNHANADIRDTLKNDKSMFLAYNNGITAIATDVLVDTGGSEMNVSDRDLEGPVSKDMVTMGVLRAIKNFQIVNGGQTTASIFKAKKSDSDIKLDGVFVQVKLIVLPEDNNVNEIAGNISKCSNTQNAVKDADFSVSDKFNTMMQELSRSMKIPNKRGDISYWYYERIRGQYEDELSRHKNSKNQREAFLAKYPKEYRFSKEMLAIARISWEYKSKQTDPYEPSEAVKGAGTTYATFLSDIRNHNTVPDEDYFKQTVAILIIQNYLKSREENKEYKNAKASVIAYSLAYLHDILGDELDLMKIWESQRLTTNQRKALDLLADNIHRYLCIKALDMNTTVLSYGKRKTAFREVSKLFNPIQTHEIKVLMLS